MHLPISFVIWWSRQVIIGTTAVVGEGVVDSAKEAESWYAMNRYLISAQIFVKTSLLVTGIRSPIRICFCTSVSVIKNICPSPHPTTFSPPVAARESLSGFLISLTWLSPTWMQKTRSRGLAFAGTIPTKRPSKPCANPSLVLRPLARSYQLTSYPAEELRLTSLPHSQFNTGPYKPWGQFFKYY